MLQLEYLKGFVKFATLELGLTKEPKVVFVNEKQENKKLTFGHSNDKTIIVRVTNRHPMDIMRTIAHEMYHLKLHNGKSSQAEEDKATIIAGRIMKKYNGKYPQAFKLKPIFESESAIPANATGPAIATFDPLLIKKPLKRNPKRLKDIIKGK